MKIFIPPNDPCLRCNGTIKVIDDKLICSRCGQLWFIGPEGCWGADFSAPLISRGDKNDIR